MDKLKYFRKNLEHMHKVLEVKANIELHRDNRLGKYYVAHVEPNDCPCCLDNYYKFRYNANKIKKASKVEILIIILHELGHIVYNHYKIKDRIKKEYEAEKFAITQIKKHYPAYYKQAVSCVKSYIKHSDKVYRCAFTKLYEEIK